MGPNGVLLLMIAVIAAVVISWGLTIRCNDVFIQRYGKGIVSYGWAGVCGLAGLVTVVTFEDGKNDKYIALAVTIVLTVISMKQCRKRAAEMGVDKEMTKKAMFIQLIAPVGIVGIILALSIGSHNDKRKK